MEHALRDALAGGVGRAPVARLDGVTAAAEASLDRPQSTFDRPQASLDRHWGGQAYTLEPDAGPVQVAEAGSAKETPLGSELRVLDQHTAHERVCFEQLLSRAERRAAESQLLLAPAVWPLAPELLPLVEEHAEAMARLGYDVEAFGGGSVRVSAVPALLGPRDPGPALECLLRDVRDREGTEWAVAGFTDRLAATLACHSAVRAGQGLSLQSMAGITGDLVKTRHPTLCPHGRPTIVRIPQEEVSRWFGRGGWRRR